MLELMLSGNRVPVDKGPGPQTLTKGNSTTGYYGTVIPADLITGTALASAIGLTTGTDQYNELPWLKFSSYGKILFIPQRSLRYNTGWSDIYNRGAVYGSDTTGRINLGTPVMQDRKIVIAGRTYRVRLMKGDATDPATVAGGEWNRLIYLVGGSMSASYNNDYFGTTGSFKGSASWCQETRYNEKEKYYEMVARGWVSYSDYQVFPITFYDSSNSVGWRPVLELIT